MRRGGRTRQSMHARLSPCISLRGIWHTAQDSLLYTPHWGPLYGSGAAHYGPPYTHIDGVMGEGGPGRMYTLQALPGPHLPLATKTAILSKEKMDLWCLPRKCAVAVDKGTPSIQCKRRDEWGAAPGLDRHHLPRAKGPLLPFGGHYPQKYHAFQQGFAKS